MNKFIQCAMALIISTSLLTACTTSERGKAAGENIKGTTQETVGAATDNPKLQAKGKANKAKGKLRHTKEDMKDLVTGN